tara:strand:+ start:194 stop:721 length:528 start_codon:yes stop_codon:yes gene_type:complete
MDKKDILIVAIVAVVASLAVSAFTPQIGLGPPTGDSKTVFAENSKNCNLENHCNIQNAIVSNSLEARSVVIERDTGKGMGIDMTTGTGMDIAMATGTGIEITQNTGNGIHMVRSTGTGIEITQNTGTSASFSNVVGTALVVDGRVMFKNLGTQGTGNFLCVSGTGVIFRSNSTCN